MRRFPLSWMVESASYRRAKGLREARENFPGVEISLELSPLPMHIPRALSSRHEKKIIMVSDGVRAGKSLADVQLNSTAVGDGCQSHIQAAYIQSLATAELRQAQQTARVSYSISCGTAGGGLPEKYPSWSEAHLLRAAAARYLRTRERCRQLFSVRTTTRMVCRGCVTDERSRFNL